MHVPQILRAAFLAGVAVAGMTGPAAAKVAKPAFFTAGAIADAPSGFVEFCQRDRASCLAGHDRAAVSPVAATTGVTGPAQPLAFRLPFRGVRLIDQAQSFAAAINGEIERAPARHGPWRYASSYSFSDGRYARPAVARPAPATAPLLPALAGSGADMELLKKVNSEVNRSVVQVYDSVSIGRDEYWQRPTPGKSLYGDCEDIAIEKRMRLLEAGYPADKMFFAVAYLPRYGLHVLLVARMADGDYVMDSLSPHILRWSDIRYSWLRLQSIDDPMKWTRVGAPALGEPVRIADGEDGKPARS